MLQTNLMILAVYAGLSVAIAAPCLAHPTDEELREAVKDRERCALVVPTSERIDRAEIGMTGAQLSDVVPGMSDESKPDARSKVGLYRLMRKSKGDVAEVEYELWQDRVYRIRWKLSERFERPIIDTLVARAQVCFGRSEFDQKFEAEPGSPNATLRKIGWTHGDRRIELRQLHPLRGGPIYITVSDYEMLREIVSSRVAPFPAPERSGPWWERSMKQPKPAAKNERDRLGNAFVGLLSQVDH